ncbi:MAG: MFS transporter [Dongiaceae bacterium]
MRATARPGTTSGAGAATRLIVATSLGNALEFYEILVYGYFAVVLAKVFFPAADETVSMLVTLGSFGVSFLARPVGAVVFGAYGDRRGRKRALTLSILLMTAGTGLMVAMPGYDTLGPAAPVLVLCARLLQGFLVGGEFASSTAFLVEHRPDRAGYFGSWQWSSQGLAALAATGMGVFLTATLSAADLQGWGWRIPFALGLLIGPLGYYIRRRLDESPAFVESGAARAPLRELLGTQWRRLLLTVLVVAVSTGSQYLSVYMPTYAIRELGLPAATGFTAAAVAAALETLVVPFVGMLVDRVGQSLVMMAAALLFLLTAYPAFALAEGHRSLAVLIAVVCWIALLKSFFSGALPSLMAKIFPVRTRVSGMALGYNVAVLAFGGFAPFFAQSLIGLTGSRLAPSYYLMATAAVSLAALVALRRRLRV